MELRRRVGNWSRKKKKKTGGGGRKKKRGTDGIKETVGGNLLRGRVLLLGWGGDEKVRWLG